MANSFMLLAGVAEIEPALCRVTYSFQITFIQTDKTLTRHHKKISLKN
jgi:hypothetical protein